MVWYGLHLVTGREAHQPLKTISIWFRIAAEHAMPLSDFWESAECQDEPTSSSSSSSGSATDSENNAAELAKFRRKQQTEKARVAALLSRQQKRLQKESIGSAAHNPNPAADFQKTYFASRQHAKTGWWSPFEDSSAQRPSQERRRRAVWLYFTNLVRALKQFFLGVSPPSSGSNDPEHAEDDVSYGPLDISHVITVNVNDDTNIKLTAAQRSSRSIRSVMANIQHHIVFRWLDSEIPTWFLLHQPLLVLQRAVASHMCREFVHGVYILVAMWGSAFFPGACQQHFFGM